MSAIWAGYPASYTAGRRRAIQYVVLHYTAGAEGPLAAENGVAYDKRRPDGTSTHYFTDSQGPALQEVPDGDRAHAALFHGNEIGLHIEICGTRQTRAQWLDPVSLPTLQTTAELTRELCQRHGFAVRHLTVAEVRAAYYGAPGARPTGICDHWDITRAYPEDGGDHSDVGTEFPWDVFMQMVGGSTGEDDDMSREDAIDSTQMTLFGADRYGHANTGEGAVDDHWSKQIETYAIKNVEGRLTALIKGISTGGIDAAALAKQVATHLAADPTFIASVRKVVDEENDEQSRGGADTD